MVVVLSSFAIILMGKKEPVVLLVSCDFSVALHPVPWVGPLRAYRLVVIPDHTHLLKRGITLYLLQ